MKSNKVRFFNRLSFITLLATVFMTLFFFIPYLSVSLDATKGFLVSVGMTLALFFWLIACLAEGKFTVPKERLLIFAGCIPAVFLISSFFSSSIYVSLFGTGFEVGTFGSMLVLYILFFLSTLYFQTEKRLWYFYGALFVGALIIALFELLTLFVGFDRILPGFFQGISSGNLVGSWNDFALFFGLIVILAVATIEFLSTSVLARIGQYFLLVAGAFFLIVVNIPLIWLLVGLASIVVFVYSISLSHAGHARKFPFAALAVLLVSLVFLIGNNSLGALVSNYVHVPNADVRPSLTSTAHVSWQALKHNPFFGTGPNTFSIDWSLWQPKDIANTAYWNVDFVNGVGLLPTFVATTGILGVASILLFLTAFIIRGIQAMRIALQSSVTNYFLIMTLSTALYAWITMLFYAPNIVMVVIAFATSGMLIGILVHKQAIGVRTFSFLDDPRNSFFSILGLMIIMISAISLTYVYAEKFTSVIYFSKGLSSDTTSISSLALAEKRLTNAVVLDKNDVYYRTLSQVYIREIGVLINDKSISQDTLKSKIQQLVNLAQSSGQAAISQNPKQYINYVNLGNVYTALVPLGVANSYESATLAYTKASELAPNNPSILLYRAQLESAHKNNDEARKFVAQALAIKANYTDAIFFLVEIEQASGNTQEAIRQAVYASEVSPNDPTVFFRLGLLRYSSSDYGSAVSAFEAAVILDPAYMNARYYLAQAYQKADRPDDAKAQLEILQKVLPNSQEIKNALNSVSNGTPTAAVTEPLTDITPAPKTQSKKIKSPLSEKR